MESNFVILYGPDPEDPLPYWFIKQKINGTTYYIEHDEVGVQTKEYGEKYRVRRVWKDPIKIIDEFTIKGKAQDWDIAIIQPGTYVGYLSSIYYDGKLEQKYPILYRGKTKWYYNLIHTVDFNNMPKEVDKYVYGSGKYMKEPKRLKVNKYNWDWQGELVVVNNYQPKPEEYTRPYYLEYKQNGTLYYIDPFNHFRSYGTFWLKSQKGFNVFTGIRENEIQLPNNRFSTHTHTSPPLSGCALEGIFSLRSVCVTRV